MDAYAFATSATSGALDQLREMVHPDGLRVMLPLVGAHAAYAAASADSAEELHDKIDAVRNVAGLDGITVYMATTAPLDGNMQVPVFGATPTWRPPAEVIGFSMLSTQSGSTAAVYQQASGVPEVIGLAVVTASVPTVLAEITGATQDVLAGPFDQLGGLTGVVSSATSIGFTVLGRGFTRAE